MIRGHLRTIVCIFALSFSLAFANLATNADQSRDLTEMTVFMGSPVNQGSLVEVGRFGSQQYNKLVPWYFLIPFSVKQIFHLNPIRTGVFYLTRKHFDNPEDDVFEVQISFKDPHKCVLGLHKIFDLVTLDPDFTFGQQLIMIGYDQTAGAQLMLRFSNKNLLSQVQSFLSAKLQSFDKSVVVKGYAASSKSPINCQPEILKAALMPRDQPSWSILMAGEQVYTAATIPEVIEYLALLKYGYGSLMYDVKRIGYDFEDQESVQISVKLPNLDAEKQQTYLVNFLNILTLEMIVSDASQQIGRAVGFGFQSSEQGTGKYAVYLCFPQDINMIELKSDLAYFFNRFLAEETFKFRGTITSLKPASFMFEGMESVPCNDPLLYSDYMMHHLMEGYTIPAMLKFDCEEEIKSLLFLRVTFKLGPEIFISQLFASLFELTGNLEIAGIKDCMLTQIKFTPIPAQGQYRIELVLANEKGNIGAMMKMFNFALRGAGINVSPTAWILRSMKPNARESVYKLPSATQAELANFYKLDLMIEERMLAKAEVKEEKVFELKEDKPPKKISKGPTKSAPQGKKSKSQRKRERAKNALLVKPEEPASEVISEKQDGVLEETIESPNDTELIDLRIASENVQVEHELHAIDEIPEVEPVENLEVDSLVHSKDAVDTEISDQERIAELEPSAVLANEASEETEIRTETPSFSTDNSIALVENESSPDPDNGEPQITETTAFEILEPEISAEESIDTGSIELQSTLSEQRATISQEPISESVAPKKISKTQSKAHAKALKSKRREKRENTKKPRFEVTDEEPSRTPVISISHEIKDTDSQTDVSHAEPIEPTAVEQINTPSVDDSIVGPVADSESIVSSGLAEVVIEREIVVGANMEEMLKEENVEDSLNETSDLDVPPGFEDFIPEQTEFKPITDDSVENVLLADSDQKLQVKSMITGPAIKPEWYHSPRVMVTPDGRTPTFAYDAGIWEMYKANGMWWSSFWQHGLAVHVIRKILYPKPLQSGLKPKLFSLVVEIPEIHASRALADVMDWIETNSSSYIKFRTISVSLLGSKFHLFNRPTPSDRVSLVFTLRDPDNRDVDAWIVACREIFESEHLRYESIHGKLHAPTQFADLFDKYVGMKDDGLPLSRWRFLHNGMPTFDCNNLWAASNALKVLGPGRFIPHGMIERRVDAAKPFVLNLDRTVTIKPLDGESIEPVMLFEFLIRMLDTLEIDHRLPLKQWMFPELDFIEAIYFTRIPGCATYTLNLQIQQKIDFRLLEYCKESALGYSVALGDLNKLEALPSLKQNKDVLLSVPHQNGKPVHPGKYAELLRNYITKEDVQGGELVFDFGSRKGISKWTINQTLLVKMSSPHLMILMHELYYIIGAPKKLWIKRVRKDEFVVGFAAEQFSGSVDRSSSLMQALLIMAKLKGKTYAFDILAKTFESNGLTYYVNSSMDKLTVKPQKPVKNKATHEKVPEYSILKSEITPNKPNLTKDKVENIEAPAYTKSQTPFQKQRATETTNTPIKPAESSAKAIPSPSKPVQEKKTSDEKDAISYPLKRSKSEEGRLPSEQNKKSTHAPVKAVKCKMVKFYSALADPISLSKDDLPGFVRDYVQQLPSDYFKTGKHITLENSSFLGNEDSFEIAASLPPSLNTADIATRLFSTLVNNESFPLASMVVGPFTGSKSVFVVKLGPEATKRDIKGVMNQASELTGSITWTVLI